MSVSAGKLILLLSSIIILLSYTCPLVPSNFTIALSVEETNETLVLSLALPLASKYPYFALKDSVVLVELVKLSCIPRHVLSLAGNLILIALPAIVAIVVSVSRLKLILLFTTLPA
jgi:hypothetical protein